MYCSGKESIVYDESSSDSNDSIANKECSEDMNMLYLLASVAEGVSFDRLHALANVADCLRETANKSKQETKSGAPSTNEETCDTRIFKQKCPFCCRHFSRKENLRWHMKKHVKEDVDDSAHRKFLPSSLPDQRVPEQNENHLASAVPDSCGFWCVKCEKNFQREATYRVHMRFHARRRSPLNLPLPCKKCAEMCTTKTQYLIHKKMHRMEKIFRKRGFLS